MPYRENLVHRQGHGEPERGAVPVGALRLQQQLAAVRRRRRNSTPDNWGDSTNKFNSINLNHNWVLRRLEAERVHLPVRRLRQQHRVAHRRRRTRRSRTACTTGANVNTPQTTEQKKYQFRDDFSWHVTGMGGLGHDFKAGVNFINEPRLFITFNTGKGAIFNTHLDQRRERPDLRP